MINSASETQNLWDKLQSMQLISAEVILEKVENNPWYIRFLQGFAGWLAALFLFVFIGFVLVTSGIDFDNSALVLMVGFGCCLYAYFTYRNLKAKDFLLQFALAVNLCGQLVVSWGIFSVFEQVSSPLFFSLFVFQTVLVFLFNNFTARLLSAWFAITALFIGFNHLGLYDLGLSISYIVFILVWLNDYKWGKYKQLLEPVGYGLAVAFLAMNSHFLNDEVSYFINKMAQAPLVSLDTSYWFNQLLILLTFAYLFNNLRQLYRINLASQSGASLIMAAILMLAISHLVLGAIAGFMLIIIGFMKQLRLFVVLGALALLGFLSLYYYNLEWDLLYKSMLLFALSVLFLAGIIWLKVKVKEEGTSSLLANKTSKVNSTKKIAAGLMICILALINFGIFQKERILIDGDIALLELAPVDPRSLMQGDYMRLRFKIERVYLNENNLIDDKANEGYFVVQLDDNKVASFHSVYQGQEIAENQLKMQFRIRGKRLKLATHAFFFEEGTAEIYEDAKFGEFRVAESGQLLLNNLRDAQYKILGFNRPSQ